jgi:hypothetical protein
MLMNPTEKDIASSFSLGRFEEVFEFMSDEIKWEIVGEQTLTGKSNVMEHCQNISAYFQSITTDFNIQQTIVEKAKVAIMGLGEFSRDGKTTSKISACDVYEFDSEDKLLSISSYCIEVFKGKNP